jgi:uncharacterized protein (TIRG00374 family)
MTIDALKSPAKNQTRRTALLLLFVLMSAIALWLCRGRIEASWHPLRTQLRAVSWTRIALATIIIYLCYVLRAARWAVLLNPTRRTSTWQMLPAQIVGFAAVAIFGRVADFARPYMIARRTQTAVTTQIAVYSMERMFDLAAAATLFSAALAFAPSSMPHHEAFAHTGVLSLSATVILAVAAISIRIAGARLARLFERLLHPVAPKLAPAIAARVLDLQQGFKAITTFGEFVAAISLSLLMWMGIASCYLLGATAFRATPQLVGFSFSATMLVLATGIGGGIVQLPIIGWFTQIALFAAAMHTLFGVPVEAATACATVIFCINNLTVVPAGLLTAYLQGISLREMTRPT